MHNNLHTISRSKTDGYIVSAEGGASVALPYRGRQFEEVFKIYYPKDLILKTSSNYSSQHIGNSNGVTNIHGR